jgi:hypothetical protein
MDLTLNSFIFVVKHGSAVFEGNEVKTGEAKGFSSKSIAA